MLENEEEWTKKAKISWISGIFRMWLGHWMGNIVIQCPFNSGTDFYNYKSQFSIVLLAVVDASYNFMYVVC
jgi:hypothetical protein